MMDEQRCPVSGYTRFIACCFALMVGLDTLHDVFRPERSSLPVWANTFYCFFVAYCAVQFARGKNL